MNYMTENDSTSDGSNRVSFIKLMFFSVFSIVVIFICGISFDFSFGCVVGKKVMQSPGLMIAVFSVLVSELGYLIGGFIFGTLTRGVWKAWAKALILIAPNVLFRSATFILAFYNTELQQELMASKETLVVIPCLTMLISPLVTSFAIGMGEYSAKKYSLPKSVLNVAWYHWLWILPFYLFQVSGVTSFLIFLLTKFDALTDEGGYGIFSIFDIFREFPSFFVRIIILVVIGLVIFSISNMYSILSTQGPKTRFSILIKIFANWLFLTFFEFLIVMSLLGQMDKK